MLARYKRVLENAVQRGVAYLDANPDKEEAFQDWYRKISLDRLSLSSSLYCIIGQTLGDYGRLYQVDEFDQKSEEQLQRWAQLHGFVVRDRMTTTINYWTGRPMKTEDLNYRDEAYRYLTDLWRGEVEHRQLADSLSDSLVGVSESQPADS